MRIVIDGYNLLKALPEFGGPEAHDLERARHHLVMQLGRYGWLRGHQITVVFDGWIAGQPLERRTQDHGVQVIYSQRGEQADMVIRRLAPQVAHQGVVVTSDRTLATQVQQAGAEVIGAAAFGERVRNALSAGTKGRKETGSDVPAPPQASQHRGTARRLSRAERARERRFRNL